MSHSYRENIENNRDPRRRDRSRSEIRRTNHDNETTFTSVDNQQSSSTNSTIDFLKTLGLNAQLIQALINANPPKIEQTSIVQPTQTVNNAQEFASFLNSSYQLNHISINRDPRRRPISTVPSTSNSMLINNTLNDVNNNHSIDESYKQFIGSIDLSLLNDETRQRLQRISLLDDELDKLHRMHIELTKTIERRSRQRTSTKDKDPLLKENENLQQELINYLRTLKSTIMNNYSLYMSSFRDNKYPS